jgi:hypothetical protein
MSKYTLLVILGPRFSSAEAHAKRVAKMANKITVLLQRIVACFAHTNYLRIKSADQ